MGIDVRQYSHTDAELWPQLGPLACSRQVQKELEGPVFSSPAVTWFIARDGEQVVGFAAMRVDSKGYWVEYAYVIPERRKQGIHKLLADARAKCLAEMPEQTIRVCCKADRWKHYKNQGFVVSSERGSWVYGEKPCRPKKS